MPRQRQTRQRIAIENVFDHEPRPLGPAEVLDLAQEEVPKLGIATVYRALNDMVEEKLLRVVELPGQPARYEKSGLHHHHHFHCLQCDKVFDLEGCLLKSNLNLPEGFKVTGHDITLSGSCPACAPDSDES
ncbi:MAG: transcriptional repressor [Verrucomicrobia bacterium]|nr:transcriptional repressor [Verrucomicrobiota bacterium]MCH8511429.1 transcriptional repressor [Kiritimatiellia bacterium]